MSLHEYDKHRNFVSEPAARGRQAFWAGLALYANPLIGSVAQEWRKAWIAAEDDFHARGGQERSDAELARLRPKDVRLRPSNPQILRAGMLKKARALRARGWGWR